MGPNRTNVGLKREIWAKTQKEGHPCEERNRQGESHVEKRGRDWSNSVASLAMLRINGHHQKLGGKDFSLTGFRGSIALLTP